MILLVGSMTISSRGRCAGRLPRLTLRSRPARRCQRRVGLLGRGFAGRDRRLQVFEPEIELVLVELLRLPTEVIAPKLAQHVGETLVLGRISVPLGDSSIALTAICCFSARSAASSACSRSISPMRSPVESVMQRSNDRRRHGSSADHPVASQLVPSRITASPEAHARAACGRATIAALRAGRRAGPATGA